LAPTLQKQRYKIHNNYRKTVQGSGKIDAVQSIYIHEVSALLPFTIAGFYETFSWVKWKIDIVHNEDEENIQSTTREPTNTFDDKPFRIDIQKLLIPFDDYTTLHIKNNKYVNTIPLCNKTDFIRIEVINDHITKITIPGGKFRTMPIRRQRSLIHLGMGQSNIFQWDNWQRHEAIKIPTWYTITVINGPIRTKKIAIHFALEHQSSCLTAIPDVMLNKVLFPKHTYMAYHKGNKYCEIISSAKIDMHNAQYVQQKQYKNCYDYHNNTNICAKAQESQCKFAVGSLQWALKTALEKPGILPDIEENNHQLHIQMPGFYQTVIQYLEM